MSSTAAALSAKKESLFISHGKGEISFDQLAAEVYEIDHRGRKFRAWGKFLIGLFLPLLFVGHRTES